jgi:FtsP/CotA-like multicopper oxidase with cupredoxin domain
LEPVAASGPSASQADSGATAIELVVAKGRLTSGAPVLKVKQGDHVQLAITADSADELHLHGYNLHLNLKPGQRALLDFVARKTGRFTYELHHADIELGAIEVYPR